VRRLGKVFVIKEGVGFARKTGKLQAEDEAVAAEAVHGLVHVRNVTIGGLA